MDAKDLLRTTSPQAYKLTLLARNKARDLWSRPGRRRAWHAFGGTACKVEVSQAVGLGGILTHAAEALALGEKMGCQVSLSFAAPTYMPGGRKGADWLDAYFVRRGPKYTPDLPCVDAANLPYRAELDLADKGRLVWGYLAIRPDIISHVRPFLTGDYAAVHYRGSDKYLETKPASRAKVLERVEYEMGARGLRRLFATSDEPEFVADARERFGDACFSLPQTAIARAGRPPHFSDVPGDVKAREALGTMVVLGGSRVCVRTESLLSEWASTLSSRSTDFIVVRP